MPVSEKKAKGVLETFAEVLGAPHYGGNGEKCPTGRDAFWSGLGPDLIEYDVDRDGNTVYAVVFESACSEGWTQQGVIDVQALHPDVFLEPADGCTVCIYPA